MTEDERKALLSLLVWDLCLGRPLIYNTRRVYCLAINLAYNLKLSEWLLCLLDYDVEGKGSTDHIREFLSTTKDVLLWPHPNTFAGDKDSEFNVYRLSYIYAETLAKIPKDWGTAPVELCEEDGYTGDEDEYDEDDDDWVPTEDENEDRHTESGSIPF